MKHQIKCSGLHTTPTYSPVILCGKFSHPPGSLPVVNPLAVPFAHRRKLIFGMLILTNRRCGKSNWTNKKPIAWAVMIKLIPDFVQKITTQTGKWGNINGHQLKVQYLDSNGQEQNFSDQMTYWIALSASKPSNLWWIIPHLAKQSLDSYINTIQNRDVEKR